MATWSWTKPEVEVAPLPLPYVRPADVLETESRRVELQTNDGWMTVGDLKTDSGPAALGEGSQPPRLMSIAISRDVVDLIWNIRFPARERRWRGNIGPARQRFSASVVNLDLTNFVVDIELIGMPRNE